MHRTRRRSRWTYPLAPLCAATLLLALAGGPCAPGASAGEAPSVTVRVEGLDATLIPPTQVALSGPSVVKDGNPQDACSITSALGALQLASDGNWAGPWELGQYAIFTIDGETHEFEKESKANYYWSFWLNDTESENAGACEVQLHQGDRVLFFPSCYGEQCPSPAPLPLEAEAPASADVGESVQVTVRRYTSAGAGSEVAGASVVGGGAGALTEAHGRATLTFAHAGETTVYVNAPDSIRTEAVVCVHNGDDGTCGTIAPAPCPLASSAASSCGPCAAASSCEPPVVCPAASTQASTAPCPGRLPTPSLEVARAAGVVNGHAYPRRSAPRILAGSVEVPVGDTLHAVRIALSRRAHGHCYAFSGPRAAFVRASCRATPRFFAVASTSSFTYLLPGRLRAGRYVYDVEAVNDAGQTTPLTNGVSHVVFDVK
jgi:hypothetical protein